MLALKSDMQESVSICITIGVIGGVVNSTNYGLQFITSDFFITAAKLLKINVIADWISDHWPAKLMLLFPSITSFILSDSYDISLHGDDINHLPVIAMRSLSGISIRNLQF